MGFVLVLAGAVLPFLMILGVLPSTLALNFVAYGCSMGGLLLGVLGAATYADERRRRSREDEDPDAGLSR